MAAGRSPSHCRTGGLAHQGDVAPLSRSGGYTGAGRRRWRSLAVLLVGNFVTILDLFIVNVALEDMRRDLHASAADVQLFIVGYSVPYGVMLLNGARLGDRFGRRRLFLIGMAVFTIASALCGLVPSPLFLIGARAMQGIGAALLMPQVFTSLRVLFEGHERLKAFGVMGAVQGVAACISQLAGGLLIDYGVADLGWRLVFLINVPVGLAALIAGRVMIVETRAPGRTKLDLIGAGIAALGLLLLLTPLMEGRDYGWPWWSIALPIASVGVLAGFVLYEIRLIRRAREPIMDVRLFASRGFSHGVVGIFFFYSAISSFFLSFTMMLQPGLGLSPLVAGAIFTPSAIAFFGASLMGSRLARAIGHRALLIGVILFGSSFVVAMAGGVLMPGSLVLLTVAVVLNGAGQGVVIPLALNRVLSGVSEAHAGMGSGLVSTIALVGTSVGVAVVGVVFFAAVGDIEGVSAELRVATFGRALAMATICNLVATVISYGAFTQLDRTKADARGRTQ